MCRVFTKVLEYGRDRGGVGRRGGSDSFRGRRRRGGVPVGCVKWLLVRVVEDRSDGRGAPSAQREVLGVAGVGVALDQEGVGDGSSGGSGVHAWLGGVVVVFGVVVVVDRGVEMRAPIVQVGLLGVEGGVESVSSWLELGGLLLAGLL